LLSPAVIPAARWAPNKMFWFWLQPATKAPRSRPSPRRGAEENGNKQAENWWVGIRAV